MLRKMWSKTKTMKKKSLRYSTKGLYIYMNEWDLLLIVMIKFYGLQASYLKVSNTTLIVYLRNYPCIVPQGTYCLCTPTPTNPSSNHKHKCYHSISLYLIVLDSNIYNLSITYKTYTQNLICHFFSMDNPLKKMK